MLENTEQLSAALVRATAQVAGTYISQSSASDASLPDIIKGIYSAFSDAVSGQSGQAASNDGPVLQQKAKHAPAVAPNKSVFPDYIICLEDGKKFRTLRRHLRTSYKMTPEQYRERWGLPATYPIVAPNYSVTRSKMAKDIGLGKSGPKIPKTRTTRKAA